MPLNLQTDKLTSLVSRYDNLRNAGPLMEVNGKINVRISAAIGELCRILCHDGSTILAEVIGFDNRLAQILPLRSVEGTRQGATVVALGRRFQVPVGDQLLGRVIDTLGNPIDGGKPFRPQKWIPILNDAPAPMTRTPISTPLETGIRAIDGMLTLGYGQRVGLFAGGGVGKSTMLGEIAKHATSDINVVALIGERGREVEPFVTRCLGKEGLARSIVIVSTAEDMPLLQIRAAQNAITIADHYRRQGKNVLLMLDSITRLARAQRTIGTLLNEPPSVQGYPPSTFQLLASLMEQLGPGETGSITGLITVLVDGDDLSDPVADAALATLDGHIVFDRKLAHRGHFPAIDVQASVSRLFDDVTTPTQRMQAMYIREQMARYEEVEDLLRIGAYQSGASAEVDQAIQDNSKINSFLRQASGSPSSFAQTQSLMNDIVPAQVTAG